MQSINNLQEIINIYLNKKNKYTDGNYFQFGNNIVIVGNDFNYSSYINNTNLKNFQINFKQIEFIIKIIKLNKNIEIENCEVSENHLIISNYKTTYELQITPKIMELNFENEILNEKQNNLKNKELIGKLTGPEILNFLKISAAQKECITDFDNSTKNIFIFEKKYYITNKFQLIVNHINLKDCVLNIEKLTNHKNADYLNVYADADYYYYESNLNTNKILKIDAEKIYKQTIEASEISKENTHNSIILNLENFKHKKIENIKFDFAASKMIITDKNENIFVEKLNIITFDFTPGIAKLPIIELSFENFINIFNLIQNKDCVLIRFSNETNKAILIENHVIMPIRNYDYTEYNKDNIETSPPVTKEVKTKKPKTMNLKKQIKTKPIKSKYYEPITEVIEPEIIEAEIIEIENTIYESKEIVKYIAPKIDLKVEKIEIEPVTQIKKRSVPKQIKPVKKEVKNELSETIITPNFDIIDFLYIACFNELENLEFYNTDYKNNRLYLDNCELSFNQIKDKIEVTELDVNCKLHFYNIKDKKELLNLVRSKIKNAA